MSGRNAVVLLSGGLDSTTVLAIAQSEGFVAYALSFHYGQRHATELDAARRIAEAAGVGGHVVAEIDLRVFGGSALTADDRRPQGALGWRDGRGDPDHLRAGAQHDLPLVRARLGRDARRERHLRRRQRARLQRLSRLPAGVHRGVRADGEPGHQGRCRGHPAPPDPRAADPAHEGRASSAAGSSSASTTRLTQSCYDPDAEGRACGACDSCLLRLRGLREPPACRIPLPTSRTRRCGDDLHRQGDLLHAAGRGRQRRPAGGVLPLRRLQPLDRAREGSRHRRLHVLRHRLRRHRRPRRRQVPQRRRARRRRRRALAVAPTAAAGRSSSAPAASRSCSSTPPLVDALHAAGFEVAVETNGTLEPPAGIDWICVSPKAGSDTVLRRGNELKLVYPQQAAPPERFADADFEHFYLQPMDGPETRPQHRSAASSTASPTRSGGSACRPTRSPASA